MENVIKVNENLILYYEDGFLSKVKKPLDKVEINIDSDGTKHWFKNGLRHRDNDLPAIEWEDGTKYWYKNGERHRDNDLPAAEHVSGAKFWYKNGQFIRSEKS